MGEVKAVENRAATRVVVGRTLAANIRRPRRHPSWFDCRIILGHKVIHPTEEQATGIARTTDLKLARRALRQGPQAGRFAIIGDRDPHDQRRTAEYDYIAVPIGTRDELFAKGVDRTGGKHGVAIAQLADRGTGPLDPGHAGGCHAALHTDVLAPAGAVEQWVRRGRGGMVEDRLARQRVVGNGRRGPEPGRVHPFAGG